MATQDTTDKDQEVQNLYRDFPYPPKKTLEEIRGSHLRANPRLNPALFFPESGCPDDLSILIAGCGTNLAGTFSVHFPQAKIVGIDISEASLAHSQGILQQLGSTNCELHQLPLEEVESLGKGFDFIHCHGVLHHLKSPVKGLKALGSVLKPSGAMSLMVYAEYGRAGLYQVQELCRRLHLSPTLDDVKRVQSFIQAMPQQHALNILYPSRQTPIAIEELADMFLNPRDVAYTTDGIRALISDAGLKFHRWIEQGKYHIQPSPLIHSLEAQHTTNLNMWEEFAMVELFYGTIFKHRFIVTHPSRKSARELFSEELLPSAVPVRSVDLEHRDHDGTIYIANAAESPRVEVPLQDALEVALFKSIDGSKSLSELLKSTAHAQAPGTLPTKSLQFFKRLYEADIVYFKVA
jgi:SAM-dependent methyltransferase